MRREERYCPRCRMHFLLGRPKTTNYALINVSRGVTRMLMMAAQEFDEQSEQVGELYSAGDFVNWLRASLREEVA